eukprot:m.82454 g.82454  ORF g.82454 m.82454 type:complete len:270 (+) comp16337_c0_seq1:135-944(+)
MDVADDLADKVLRVSKNYLQPVGRLLLLSTFVEDGIRMFFQWGEQTEYIMQQWRTGSFFAVLFVLFNLVGQLVPCAVILTLRQKQHRHLIKLAVGCLLAVMLVQTMAYTVLWELQFFLRNFAVSGALILLYAEATDETARNMFAGVPDLGGNKSGDYLQLSGRILLVFMLLTVVKMNSILRILFDIAALVLVVLVALGFKTKVSALALVVLLQLENMIMNNFWAEYAHSAKYDFKKYDFFQTETVIGGLLMIVALGPGGVSMDEGKKRW